LRGPKTAEEISRTSRAHIYIYISWKLMLKPQPQMCSISKRKALCLQCTCRNF